MTIEPQEQLEEIYNLITDYLASGKDLLVSTQKLLLEIISKTGVDMVDTNLDSDISTDKEIIISCDASITVNPGGVAAVGIVIRFPDVSEPIKIGRIVPSTTNNEAEYDAIYESLVFLSNTLNKPRFPICIFSDSQLVVKQLKGEYKINLDALQRKHDSIHELAAALPVAVQIKWKPRNSTADLTEANFLAQDVIGVKRH